MTTEWKVPLHCTPTKDVTWEEMEYRKNLMDGCMWVLDVQDLGRQYEVLVREFPPKGARDTVQVGRRVWQNGSVWVIVDVTAPDKIHLREDGILRNKMPIPNDWIAL